MDDSNGFFIATRLVLDDPLRKKASMTHRWGAPRRAATTTLLLVLAAIHGAISASQSPQPASAAKGAASVVRLPAFRDVASSAGIDFVHSNGASEQRLLPEIIGSGGLLFDFDNDGWLDVFLVDGGSLADAAVARRARHRLYRNRGP